MQEQMSDMIGNLKPDVAIPLSAEQRHEFSKVIRIGIYKELHKKELLTDAQLQSLLKLKNE